jgi:hypothetical protein
VRRFILVIVGACTYAPTPASVTDPNDGPPTDSDAPSDLPPGDPDGDGVPNPLDNCPTLANTTQHDEDGDDIGDPCDPCPQLSGANTDGDGDGIGDACDPRPSLAGDTLVHFLPFDLAGQGLPAGWISIGGATNNWSTSDDELVNEAVEATKQITFDLGARPQSIDIGIDITGTTSTTDTVGAGAVIEGNGTQSSYYMCFVQTVTTAQFTQLIGPGTTTLLSATPGPTLPGRYRIATYFDGAQLHCRFGGASAPADLTTTRASLGSNQVGIRLRNVQARIEYVAIYRSP